MHPGHNFMNHIETNLIQIEESILKACQRSGRSRQDIQILLATKTVKPNDLRIAYDLGYTLMGENKVQELLEKSNEVKADWHFIGHLQTNKVKSLMPYISCLHSVDRWSLVLELDKRLKEINKKLNIFVQVNTSGESSKYGLGPDAVTDFVTKLQTVSTLQIKGFMTLAEFSADSDISRSNFKVLKNLQKKVSEACGVFYPELSMGMSNDYLIAIEEGATIVRIGTSVFGVRDKPDTYYWPI